MRVAHDRSENDKHLLGCPRPRVPSVPTLDVLAGDGGDVVVAERRQQMGAERVAVVAQRPVLEAALAFAVEHPVLGHVHEARPGPGPGPRRPAWRTGQDLAQQVLGVSWTQVQPIGLGSVGCSPDDGTARCALAAILDRRWPKDALMPAVGVAPQRVPPPAAAALDDLDMARGRVSALVMASPICVPRCVPYVSEATRSKGPQGMGDFR